MNWKMENIKPILGISLGDPAGIGPEIAVKALNNPKTYELCRPILVGDAGSVQDALRITGLPLALHAVGAVKDAKFQRGTVDLYDLRNVDKAAFRYGEVSAMCGNAAFEAVKKVIDLAMSREIDGTVTGPLNKEALNLAGHHFSGHTEIYAHYTNTKDYCMMLCYGDLRVAHVSTHVALREACDRVKKDRVLRMIRLADEACRKFGIEKPRIAVAGLNPHAGENGLFGREEIEEIAPAVEQARKEGLQAEGPVPPDSVFPKAKGGWYDIVVAMYHDQGHIPLKVLGFNWNREHSRWESIAGVNITLGLPIVRSSVDHGTAFEIAGRGIALEASMLNAIEYGARLSGRR